MTVRPRGDGFQADFTHKGGRYRAQFPAHQAALQWEADTIAALVAGRPLPQAPTGAAQDNTIGALTKRTVERYWKGSKNEEGASRNAQAFVDFFGSNTPVDAINSAKIDEWVMALERGGNSGSTVNRKLAALTKVLRYGVLLGMIPAVPAVERRKEGAPRLRFLTEPEATALIDLINHWGKADEALLVTFLIDTGARIGEAMKVRRKDVGEDRVTLGAMGSKNGEWRVVPLTRRLREQMPRLLTGLSDRQEVFGSRINRWGFRSMYMRAVEQLNMGGDVVIHTLRHTTASWLVQRGVDIRRVQAWLGHKSLAMTLRYAKLAPNDLFSAVEKFDTTPDTTNVVTLKRTA